MLILHLVDKIWHSVGSWVVRIDLLHFLAGYHTRQLNQA